MDWEHISSAGSDKLQGCFLHNKKIERIFSSLTPSFSRRSTVVHVSDNTQDSPHHTIQ